MATELAVRQPRSRKTRERHGASGTDLYSIYVGMIARCTNPKHSHYPRYGARGIKVRKRWLDSFDSFRRDMGPRPSPAHSVGRIDNDGDYRPDNCEWQTQAEQMRNTCRTLTITSSSGESLRTHEWCQRLKISRQRLHQRLERMPDYVAVSFPNGGTSPEYEAWKAERQMNRVQLRWRERHLRKLAFELERLSAGKDIAPEVTNGQGDYLTHTERRLRRKEMARLVREGNSVADVATSFGVTAQTVRCACKEHKVKA